MAVGKGDAIAALTRNDAVNILACLMGKAMGASTTVARYNRLDLFDLITTSAIDAGVSSEVSAANEVLRFVRRGAYVSAVSFMTGDVDRPDEMLIGGVLRDGEAIVPRGATRFAEGDRVVVLATPDSTAAVEKMFTV